MLVESLYADPVVAELHEVRRRLLEASGGDVEEFRRRLRDREKAYEGRAENEVIDIGVAVAAVKKFKEKL